MCFVVYGVSGLPTSHRGPLEITNLIHSDWSSSNIRNIAPEIPAGAPSGEVLVEWLSKAKLRHDISPKALKQVLRKKYPNVTVTVVRDNFEEGGVQ
jgi:hypothetical protein